MSEQRTPKCKNMMLTQQVQYLPDNCKTATDLAALIESRVEPKEYAVILHDQDIDEYGQPAEPHIHAMMCFTNACHITSIAKKLGIEPQYIAKWDGKVANGYAYLLHATAKARKEGKHQYGASDVLANFDFEALALKIQERAIVQPPAEHGADSVNTLLDQLYVGIISKADIEGRLSGSQYAKYHRQIEDVDAKRLLRQAEKWREEMKAKNAKIRVIWIYGPAGSGKTSLAKEYAEKADQGYYISGSTRDLFQGYNGEHTLILDELRPRVIRYPDLLRITDPHGIDNQVMAPARYSDKALACDLIIVTSPYSPYSFYQKCGLDENEDYFEQLARRITLTIAMDAQAICGVKFERSQSAYAIIPGTNRPNPYSNLARPAPPDSAEDLYNSIFG